MAKDGEQLKSTPLAGLHRALGARFAPFAGYWMPIQYDFPNPYSGRCAGGVIAEHRHCREQAALFDVSHMGQAMLSGDGVTAALERLSPIDLLGLAAGRQRYAVLTNEAGGILDDLMVSHLGNGRWFVVANAARKGIDFPHIAVALPAGAQLEVLEDRAIIAVQGPRAADVLAAVAPAAPALGFMDTAEMEVAGAAAVVSRSGYTGEDGFELSVPSETAEPLARRLLKDGRVVFAGLGARDSLRLEAGLCLYGNDIDETTTPVEASITFAIGKRRRLDWSFAGADPIRDQLANGAPRVRVGLRFADRVPARAGAQIVAADGTLLGRVTSGGFSPTLNVPIAMGYVRRDHAAPGTSVGVLVRGRSLAATVAPLPFVPHRYAR
jgi:aminomethyltransferase